MSLVTFCHHTARGGRTHGQEAQIVEGVDNILQCSVTTWSEHVKHFVLTSDFDSTDLTSEEAKLMASVMEARKSAWARTGSAAISTANNGTSAGVLALVRRRWYSNPQAVCTDEAGVLYTNPRMVARVIRVMGTEIMLLTAYFAHSV